MILALSLVTLVGAVVVGFAEYPQTVVVEVQRSGEHAGEPVFFREHEVSCPGPLRGDDELPPFGTTSGPVVWPPPETNPLPCQYERDKRQAGTWLAIALSGLAALTALALLRRAGPSPDLDPPQPDPITRKVPDL
jgi:hypothetical protein